MGKWKKIFKTLKKKEKEKIPCVILTLSLGYMYIHAYDIYRGSVSQIAGERLQDIDPSSLDIPENRCF